jgi:hypothetical protein
MNNPTLFMLMLGCKPPGRHTEQHDVMFTVADDFLSTEQDARAFWPESEKIHIDAYRTVTKVDRYKISIVQKGTAKTTLKLFFVNLGGYIPDVFDEFHYKILVVAKTIGEAQRIAKRSPFCLHHPGPSKNALPHIDDEYGVDVDDTYHVEDILPDHIKESFSIEIEDVLFEMGMIEDKISIGYQRYEKIRMQKANE